MSSMGAASASTTDDAVSRVILVTTDEEALPEFCQVIPPSLETIRVNSLDEMDTALAESHAEAVILDLDIIATAANEAIARVRDVRGANPDLVIIALTRSRNRSVRLKAEQAGADEFFLAPVEAQELRIVLERTIRKRRVEIEDRELREQVAEKYSFGELIGGCDAMQRVYEAISRVARGNTTVILRGESGTGKELVARSLVANSGHEKGAFTGADTARPGHIELADGGTLFLDEISSLGLALQSKLLRVLQDHTVTRVGGKTPRKIDFRLIAATNDDLEQMVAAGKFREDLYYRINVIPIHLPPLRERTGDVSLLVEHFLRIYCAANQKPMVRIESDALEILEEHSWPGNIRELENLIQRLVVMGDGDVISAKHLPNQILYISTAKQEALLIPEGGIDLEDELTKIESAFLQAAIRRCGGKKVTAAALLRINAQKMKYLCRKHGLQGLKNDPT